MVGHRGARPCVGSALAAPLLLPGLQLGVSSARKNAVGAPAFSLVHLPNLLTGGLQGLDFTNSAYVGVIVLMLAAVRGQALLAPPRGARTRCRRGGVHPPHVLRTPRPTPSSVTGGPHHRVEPVGDGAAARVGGVGRLRGRGPRLFGRKRDDGPGWATWTLGAGAAVVAGVVLAAVLGLTPVAQHQLGSLAWPLVELVIGTGAVAALKWPEKIASHLPTALRRLSRYIVVALLGANSAFLIFSGVSFWSESSTYFSPHPRRLGAQGNRRDVGSWLRIV